MLILQVIIWAENLHNIPGNLQVSYLKMSHHRLDAYEYAVTAHTIFKDPTTLPASLLGPNGKLKWEIPPPESLSLGAQIRDKLKDADRSSPLVTKIQALTEAERRANNFIPNR